MSGDRPLSERPAARRIKPAEKPVGQHIPYQPPPATQKQGKGCLFWFLIIVAAIVVISIFSSIGGGGSSSAEYGPCTGQKLDTDSKIKAEAICQFGEVAVE